MRLVERLGMVQKAVLRTLRRNLAARSDRPFQQFRALRVIQFCGDPCTQSELADKLFIDAAAASRLVDRLVADGLVKRAAGTDRRTVNLRLTRAAARELAILEEANELVEEELISQLGVESARQIEATLAPITDRWMAELDPAPVTPRAESARRAGTRRPRRQVRRRKPA